jgi:hypothetical protein
MEGKLNEHLRSQKDFFRCCRSLHVTLYAVRVRSYTQAGFRGQGSAVDPGKGTRL